MHEPVIGNVLQALPIRAEQIFRSVWNIAACCIKRRLRHRMQEFFRSLSSLLTFLQHLIERRIVIGM